MRACAAVEQLGIPTVALVGADFERMARSIARSMGRPAQPIATYPSPGIIMTDPEDVFRQKVVEHMLPVVIDALDTKAGGSATSAAADAHAEAVHVEPRATVFSGDYDAIQEYFLERGWSDGLPIVPPTIERVTRFLQHTRRDADEVLGVLLPDQRQATVLNVAVNGVMAGCRPEYMPVLLAVAEAIADPAFHIQD